MTDHGNVLDILIYVFDRYMLVDDPDVPEREELAEDLQKAGFEGVEIHGAHGYILAQFLSDEINHRTDQYGGSLENRMRIVMRIIDAAREEVGPDAIVGLRLNSDDGMQGGLGPGLQVSLIAQARQGQ